jgi:MFS family permease
MSSTTGSYTIPYALALGANAGEIGLLSSAQKLANTLVQPLAQRLIATAHSRKKVTEWAALLSRLLWIPIIITPFWLTGPAAIAAIIILLALSSALSGMSGTAWSSWICDLVPEKLRGKFFGYRNALTGISGFAALLLAGWAISSIDGKSGFSTVFTVALLFGIISFFYLSRTPEPKFKVKIDKIMLREALRELSKDRRFRHFTIYMAAFSFATYIAAPFFAVSMLHDYNIGYDAYAIVMAVSMIATIMAQPYWGKMTDKYGDRTVLAICGILASIVPGAWLLVREPLSMTAVLAFSGFAWAGFELAAFNYLLGVSAPAKRHAYIANYSFVTGLATFIGPLIGGALAVMYTTGILWLSGLSIAFAASFVLRLIITGLFVPYLSEVRQAQSVPISSIFWKAITVYPVRSMVHEVASAERYLYFHMRHIHRYR